LSLSSQQRKCGVEAEVLTLNRDFRDPRVRLPGRDVVEGVPVRRIGYAGSRRYPIAPGALRHLRGFDIVHVHAVDFFCDFLAWTAPVHRKPLAISTHGGFFHTSFARSLKQYYFRTVTRASLTRYSRVFACSAADAATFAPVAAQRLRVIENAVDTRKFAMAG